MRVGGVSTVTVTLSDNANSTNSVTGFEFDLDFNPAILQAMSVTEEGYFANNGIIGLTTVTINNTKGTIDLISDAAATPEDPGKGDPLVDIAFSAVGSGASPITIADETISGSQFNAIQTMVMDTNVNVPTSVPEPRSLLLAGIGLVFAIFGTRSGMDIFKTGLIRR